MLARVRGLPIHLARCRMAELKRAAGNLRLIVSESLAENSPRHPESLAENDHKSSSAFQLRHAEVLFRTKVRKSLEARSAALSESSGPSFEARRSAAEHLRMT
jgi:hypothetical protein